MRDPSNYEILFYDEEKISLCLQNNFFIPLHANGLKLHSINRVVCWNLKWARSSAGWAGKEVEHILQRLHTGTVSGISVVCSVVDPIRSDFIHKLTWVRFRLRDFLICYCSSCPEERWLSLSHRPSHTTHTRH